MLRLGEQTALCEGRAVHEVHKTPRHHQGLPDIKTTLQAQCNRMVRRGVIHHTPAVKNTYTH
eukprot:1184131-Prorocentrum_minimum.AAC.5